MTKTRLKIHFRIKYPKFEWHEAFSSGVHPKNCFAKNIHISASIPEKSDEFVSAVSRFSEPIRCQHWVLPADRFISLHNSPACLETSNPKHQFSDFVCFPPNYAQNPEICCYLVGNRQMSNKCWKIQKLQKFLHALKMWKKMSNIFSSHQKILKNHRDKALQRYS